MKNSSLLEIFSSSSAFDLNLSARSRLAANSLTSFSKALTIIYTLQSSIDFEKDLNIAKNLFQIYEFTRITLINEFKSCHVEKSLLAASALQEIRDTWRHIS